MEYITVAEAAEIWGVTSRQVQRLIAANRIPNVKKHGQAYMIPANAEKPNDPRFEKETPPSVFLSDLEQLIPAVYTFVPQNDPFSIMNTITEKRLKLIHEGGFAYICGDFARTIKCYKQNEGDDAAKLCSSTLAIAAAISMGDYPFYLEVEAFLKSIIAANVRADVTAFAELSLCTAYLGAMAPNMAPEWLKNGDFSALPSAAKPDAAYKRAKYFQCIGKYGSMLDVAQTALAFCDSPRKISVPGIYLRMMCAAACFSLGRNDDAKTWLQDAMRIALPHGFITYFAELIPLFGGMIEQILKYEYPSYYDAIINQKKPRLNWLSFHNRFTKDNITLILSLRDYQMALLVARHVPYKEIAHQFNISVGRLNNIMRGIYAELFVSNRDELAKFIL